jgi:hypothetical protein
MKTLALGGPPAALRAAPARLQRAPAAAPRAPPPAPPARAARRCVCRSADGAHDSLGLGEDDAVKQARSTSRRLRFSLLRCSAALRTPRLT